MYERPTEPQVQALQRVRACYIPYCNRVAVPNPDECSKLQASRAISEFHRYVDPITSRAYWTKESIATAALVELGSVGDAYEMLRPLVGTWLTFERNPNPDGSEGSERIPLPMADQHERLVKLLRRIAKHGHKETGKGKTPDSDWAGTPIPEPVPSVPAPIRWDNPDADKAAADAELPSDDGFDTYYATPKVTDADSPPVLLARIDAMREHVTARNADGKAMDDVGMRPYVNGAKLWRAGIHVDAILHAASMSYSREVRETLGIADVDVTAYPAPTPRTWDGEIPATTSDAAHPALPYVLAAVSARVPVMLIGGKGTGKTTLAKSVADALTLAFETINCNANLPMAVFYGRQKPLEGTVVESVFTRIVREGGVLLLDESDAMDANAATVLHELLANRRFTNPITGTVTHAHDDFVCIAAANTMGMGATAEFRGREGQDGALLDRFALGRVKVNFDATLAHKLFWQGVAA